MLSSAEHEISNTHKYKKYQEIQLFAGSDKPRVLFSLPINVKMPAILSVTILARIVPEITVTQIYLEKTEKGQIKGRI